MSALIAAMVIGRPRMEPELSIPNVERPVHVVEVSGIDGSDVTPYPCIGGTTVRFLDSDLVPIRDGLLIGCLKEESATPQQRQFMRGDVDADGTVNLSDATGVPYYRQIVDQVAQAIRSGQLLATTRLPSVRELAAQLLVSLITIRRAYADLEAAGLITRRQGQGTFVAEQVAVASREQVRAEARALMADAVANAQRLQRDPFQAPADLSDPTSVAGSSARPQAVEVEIRGILFAGGEALVNFGGEIIGPGEEVNGYRLLQVEEERAVFQRGDEIITLSLYPDAEDERNDD